MCADYTKSIQDSLPPVKFSKREDGSLKTEIVDQSPVISEKFIIPTESKNWLFRI
ncbi:hypothetical protein HZS_3887 [Henneguya salminicola]|nr:hypothetical protein HZS_3887 [Henneguya salminicola]